MNRFTNAALCGISFIFIFVMGALHPVIGYIYLAAWLFVLLPFFWRRAARFNMIALENRKKRNIEAQIILGQADSQLIQDVAAQMRRDGRL